MIFQDERVEASALEGLDRITRPTHDRLLNIERSVEHHWAPRQLFKLSYQLPVARVRLPAYRLRPRRAIYVNHRRKPPLLPGRDVQYGDHKRIVMWPAKNFGTYFFLH